MNPQLKEDFFNFLYGSISINDIKNIIFDNIFEIEDVFSKDDYFNIIDFNFNNKYSSDELSKIILKYINIAEYNTWKIAIELNNIINRINLRDTLLNFYFFHSYSFLKKLEHYGSNISTYLEEPEYYNDDFIDNYINEEYENIRTEAESILQDLNKGNIVITDNSFIGNRKY